MIKWVQAFSCLFDREKCCRTLFLFRLNEGMLKVVKGIFYHFFTLFFRQNNASFSSFMLDENLFNTFFTIKTVK